MEIQKTPKGQSIIETENRGGEIILPNLRLYYKATVIKHYGTGSINTQISGRGWRIQNHILLVN